MLIGIICVNEDQIINGIKYIYDELQIVIEPSAAVSPAVLLTQSFKTFKEENNIKKVGVILSGGNVDPNL